MQHTPALTSAESIKALKKFAAQIMQFNYPYPKAVVMGKILKKVNGDVGRAKNGYYMMVKAGIIKNEIGGKVMMPNK